MLTRCVLSRALLRAPVKMLAPRLASTTASGSTSFENNQNSNLGIHDKARLKEQAKIATPGEAINMKDIQPKSGKDWANKGDTHQQDISGASRAGSNASEGAGRANPAVSSAWQGHGETATDSSALGNTSAGQEWGPLRTDREPHPNQPSWRTTGAGTAQESKAQGRPAAATEVSGVETTGGHHGFTAMTDEELSNMPTKDTSSIYRSSATASDATEGKGIVQTVKDWVLGADSEKGKRDEHRWQSHQDSLAESTQSAFDTTVDARAPHVANSGSVVAFLKEQHQEIKSQFETVRASHGDAKMKAFDALRRLLAAHQAAEERVVHPVAQKELAGGETIIITRLQEEHDAKELLAKMEDMDVNTAEFDEKLEMLRKSVVAHAEAEEKQEFNKLEKTLDQDRLETMRKAAELVEGIAPTRPHPGVESATANTILGPFASVVDRTWDALAGKSV